MRDVEARERFNQLIDELNLYLGDKSFESCLERLKFAQDELEVPGDMAEASKPRYPPSIEKRGKKSKKQRRKESAKPKMYCVIYKGIMNVDEAHINDEELVEVLLSCGHKQLLKIQKPPGRAEYIVYWDLSTTSHSSRRAFYHMLNEIRRGAGKEECEVKSAFKTKKRELALEVYTLASKYGKAKLYEAKTLNPSQTGRETSNSTCGSA